MRIRNTRLSNLNTGQKISNASSYGWAPVVRKITQSKDRSWTCFQIGQSVNQSINQWLNSTTHTNDDNNNKEKKKTREFQSGSCLSIHSVLSVTIIYLRTVTPISNGSNRSKEGSLQRDSLTSIRLYSCMTYNHHDRFLSLSFIAVVLSDILHGQEKANILVI